MQIVRVIYDKTGHRRGKVVVLSWVVEDLEEAAIRAALAAGCAGAGREAAVSVGYTGAVRIDVGATRLRLYAAVRPGGVVRIVL